MTAEELVGVLYEGSSGASVYLDMSGGGGPYLVLQKALFYPVGVNNEPAFILVPARDEANKTVRQMMAHKFGERVRRAIAELNDVEAELV